MRRGQKRALWCGAGLLALIVAITATGALTEPNIAIPAGLRGRHVRIGDLPLRVFQRGSGRDILLIHGSPGCIEDFAPLIDALARSYRVTAYDRPGHGFSGDSGSYSIAYNARVASELIDALQLSHVTVVGHSYGGATALALAVNNPPAIHAYVALDSAVYELTRPLDPAFALLAPPWFGMGFAVWIGARVARPRLREGLTDEFKAGPPPPGFIALRERVYGTPKVVHAIAMEWRGASAGLAAQSPHYPEIRRPLQILSQGDDPSRRAAAERLRRDVPGSTLRLLPGAGHYLQLERTDAVVAAVRAAAGDAQR